MKYCVVYVDDRAADNINRTKSILSDFEYVEDIKYINGNNVNAKEIIKNTGINLDCWKPYDGRALPPIPGEYGFFATVLSYFQYILDHKIDRLLVIEDDAILLEDFMSSFNKCIDELPEDFDFLSLYYFDAHNQLDKSTDIGLKNIHLASNEYSGTQAMLYSYSCAKKFIKAVKRLGMEYTADCMLYKLQKIGTLNGYSIKPDNLRLLEHDNKNILSVLDPSDVRCVL